MTIALVVTAVLLLIANGVADSWRVPDSVWMKFELIEGSVGEYGAVDELIYVSPSSAEPVSGVVGLCGFGISPQRRPVSIVDESETWIDIVADSLGFHRYEQPEMDYAPSGRSEERAAVLWVEYRIMERR